jgi:hypothetical protein
MEPNVYICLKLVIETTFCCLKVSKHIIETHHWQVQINLHDQWICQDLISLKMYLSLWLFPFYRQKELVLTSRLLWWLAQYHATRLGSCNWEAAAARSSHGTVKLIVLHCGLTEICQKSFKGFGSQGLGYTGSLTDGVTWWWVRWWELQVHKVAATIRVCIIMEEPTATIFAMLFHSHATVQTTWQALKTCCLHSC